MAPPRVLPDEQRDVELPPVVGRRRRDGGADGDPAVCLHEARAVQVVAPRRLVRVALYTEITIACLVSFLDLPSFSLFIYRIIVQNCFLKEQRYILNSSQFEYSTALGDRSVPFNVSTATTLQ